MRVAANIFGRQANGSWSTRPPREMGKPPKPCEQGVPTPNPVRPSPTGCNALIYCLNRSIQQPAVLEMELEIPTGSEAETSFCSARTRRLQHRDIEHNDLPGLQEIDGGCDSRGNWLQGRPMIRGQNEKSQLTVSKILLMPQILIASEQQFESRLLSRVKQRAVLQSLPAQFIRPHDLVSSQKPGERGGRVGVEQDLHATAAGCSRELLAKART